MVSGPYYGACTRVPSESRLLIPHTLLYRRMSSGSMHSRAVRVAALDSTHLVVQVCVFREHALAHEVLVLLGHRPVPSDAWNAGIWFHVAVFRHFDQLWTAGRGTRHASPLQKLDPVALKLIRADIVNLVHTTVQIDEVVDYGNAEPVG
eukprot:scaffold72776_cov69-Phaeocystis_antarctica.AAC.4